MAIDLSLYLQSEVSAGELIAECRKALQASPVREHTPEVSETRVDAERNQVLREAYNLTATKGLQFRLDTSGDLDPQMLAVLGASLRVLARYPGDAVLIYNGDVAYFLRRKGTLVLNSRDGMWGPERLALVHGDSVREDLVDLL